MNCSELETRIDAFVDGELDQAERADVQSHLEHCDECRAAVEQLRALLRSAQALPRDVAPPRDLFPEIRSSLPRRHATASPALTAARGGAWLGWAGLAASLLILLTGSVLFLGRERAPAPASLDAARPAAVVGGSLYLAAEQDYLRATEQLMAALEERRGELSPETAAVVEQNLEIIDTAIAEVKKALDEDPADARNGQFLNALHRQKIQLLWRASRLSS
jgi:anti-sigma factor RsiW